MKNNSPKSIALKTLIRNKLYSLSACNDLLRIIEANQFTVIEYKKHTNSEPVSELIKKLKIENEIEQNDSFLYVRDNFKFLFINSDIPEESKCALLRHELGHICDPDFKNGGIQNSKIKKEEFANEFSCYTKNPGILYKIYFFLIKKWKLLAGIIASIVCVSGLCFMINSLTAQPSQYVTNDIPPSVNSDNTYYVTSGGEKYHQKNCMVIKYRTNLTELALTEAIGAGYEPCLICIPEE